MAKRKSQHHAQMSVRQSHVKWMVLPLVIIFLVLQYKLWFGQGGYIEALRLRRSIGSLEITNAALTERNDDMSRRIVDLREQEAAIEGVARRELGWVKPNETFFMVIDHLP